MSTAPHLLHSFPPVVDARSRILVLGSMPGVMSLEKREYYGHPMNIFWKIIFSMFGREIADTYGDKIAFLKKNFIALWDVLESCERAGSADAAIRNPSPNDIKGLLRDHPAIRCVLFNGKSVEKLFRAQIGYNDMQDVSYYTLPSTSPAHAVRFEVKYNAWESVMRECFAMPGMPATASARFNRIPR